jgi:hypothetical protein
MSSSWHEEFSGDTIFVVGNDQVRISVSSQLLCVASKPFSKMLGPDFSEGQPDKADTIREISLPDDKPSATKLMCDIIHHRIHDPSLAPTAAELHDLAIVSDKYDCIQAISLAATAWIQPDATQHISELGMLMATAFMLKLSAPFYRVTKTLILGCEGSYHSLADIPGFVDRLGWEIIRAFYLMHNLVVMSLQFFS